MSNTRPHAGRRARARSSQPTTPRAESASHSSHTQSHSTGHAVTVSQPPQPHIRTEFPRHRAVSQELSTHMQVCVRARSRERTGPGDTPLTAHTHTAMGNTHTLSLRRQPHAQLGGSLDRRRGAWSLAAGQCSKSHMQLALSVRCSPRAPPVLRYREGRRVRVSSGMRSREVATVMGANIGTGIARVVVDRGE